MGRLVSIPLVRRHRLTAGTFELHFTRPPGFDVKPGQKITLHKEGLHRDYSLINGPREKILAICVRLVPDGQLTPVLDRAAVGDCFDVTLPFGHFLYQPTGRAPVFIATGTGVAPFVSYVRSGVRGFRLLHGVRTEEHLYYRNELQKAAQVYLPCLSGVASSADQPAHAHAGRVTDFLENHLVHDSYDFYLCGRRDMIRDATRIIDRKFNDARVFTEIFY